MPRNVLKISFDQFASDVSYFRKPKTIAPEPIVVDVAESKHPNNGSNNTGNAFRRPVTDIIDIIDRSMDIQQVLFEMAQLVNAYFCFQTLMVILSAFIRIVFDCYYMLDTLTSNNLRK